MGRRSDGKKHGISVCCKILICRCLYLLQCAYNSSGVAIRFVFRCNLAQAPTVQSISGCQKRRAAVVCPSPASLECLTRSADKCSFFYGSRQLRTRACHDDYKSGPPRKCLSLALAGWASYGMLQEEPGTLRYCQGEVDTMDTYMYMDEVCEPWVWIIVMLKKKTKNCFNNKLYMYITYAMCSCILIHMYIHLCNKKRANTPQLPLWRHWGSTLCHVAMVN